jgi:5-methyltetrahydropteroyltriglutamate--homocysteine methyltransferase
MRRSTHRILITHVGSLPRPDDLVAINAKAVAALTHGETVDDQQRTDRLRSAVVEVVQKQRELGIDIVNDGEFGKATVGSVDYGAWQSYAYERLTGWEPGDLSNAPHPSQVDLGRAVPGGVPDRKERHMAEFEGSIRSWPGAFPAPCGWRSPAPSATEAKG